MNLIKTAGVWILTLNFFSPVLSQGTSVPDGIEHPYLFFSESHLPEIRERLEKEPFRTRWRIFLENADRVLETRPYYYDGEGSRIGRARKYLENAGKTAFAYIITGDKRYADRAIAEAMAISEGVIPSGEDGLDWYNPGFREWNKGADLSTAELCYGLAMVYDWCHDALTGEQKKQIRESIEEKGLRHYLVSIEGPDPDFWVGNPVSNWAGVVHGGVGLAALALYNESEMARKAAEYARKYIPEFLDHVFLEDGGGHEGIMYARYGELFGLYFMMAAQRLFGMDEEFLAQLNHRLAGYWDIYMQAPDMAYANFNNIGEHTFRGLWGTDHRSHGGPNSDINALMENLVPGGDPLLLWAADNGAPRFYWDGASPWSFLWRRASADPVPPEDKPDLQESVLFRGAGHAIFRSDRMWVAFNGGWTSNRSHNNRDLGSFILVVDRERMIHDPGYGDGHALHHSTITVGGEDQLQARSGRYLGFGSGDSFHYLANDLSDAYDPDHLDKFVRHLVFMKKGYLVLLDEIRVSGDGELEWRLQTRHEAELEREQNALILGKEHHLHLIHAGDRVVTEVVEWEGKNGKMRAVSKTPVDQRKEHENESLFVTMLYPVALSERNSSSPPELIFEDGTVTVGLPDGTKDRIRFRRQEQHWILEGINGEEHPEITDGSKRSLVPFRKTGEQEPPIDQLPPWFYPIAGENDMTGKNVQ